MLRRHGSDDALVLLQNVFSLFINVIGLLQALKYGVLQDEIF